MKKVEADSHRMIFENKKPRAHKAPGAYLIRPVLLNQAQWRKHVS
jgi:hypothetical protein